MNNKQKLIKTGFFTASTILVLIVATVAWYAIGYNTNVDEIKSDIVHGSYSAIYYESPDYDKDGELDTLPEWNLISTPYFDIANMVPGETHFYRVAVTVYEELASFKFNFGSIETIPPAGATKADVLGRINVYFETKDGEGNPVNGSSTQDTDMLTFLGNPDATEKTVFDMDLSGYTIPFTFDLYYFIGIEGSHIAAVDDIIQGASFVVGNIDFSAA